MPCCTGAKRPRRPHFSAAPIVAPVEPTSPLATTPECPLGQADAPITDSNGETIGTIRQCVGGSLADGVQSSGQVDIPLLAQGTWKLRICLRFADSQNRMLRGDTCAYRTVTLDSPGPVSVSSDSVLFKMGTEPHPIASSYADVYLGDSADQSANSAVQANGVPFAGVDSPTPETPADGEDIPDPQ